MEDTSEISSNLAPCKLNWLSPPWCPAPEDSCSEADPAHRSGTPTDGLTRLGLLVNLPEHRLQAAAPHTFPLACTGFLSFSSFKSEMNVCQAGRGPVMGACLRIPNVSTSTAFTTCLQPPTVFPFPPNLSSGSPIISCL